MNRSNRSTDLPEVDPRIEHAQTLPGSAYLDRGNYEVGLERVWGRGWNLVPEALEPLEEGEVLPFTFLPESLNEPLVMARLSGEGLGCHSNVCTHRGALLVSGRGRQEILRCPYHGRRFGLDGRCAHAPGFDKDPGFPRRHDHLPQVVLGQIGPLPLVALDPVVSLKELLAPLQERLGFLLDNIGAIDRGACPVYDIETPWLAYADNYLEGFHVPFVHPSLSRSLDFAGYSTELFEWGTLQIGLASTADAEATFELPPGHPDSGRAIAAYYAYLFPGTMLNFYPWGLSVNVLQPLAPDRTRVRYFSFVSKPELREVGVGAALDQVEREDQYVVGLVQRGLRSRLYTRGSYAPEQEPGVHHVHRLLLRELGRAPTR